MENIENAHLARTEYYIEKGTEASLSEQETEELRELVLFYQKEYYRENKSLISDSAFDKLFLLLKKAEERNPAAIFSPIQEVGSDIIGEKTMEHYIPMISLENAFDSEDLRAFDKRTLRNIEADICAYTVEPKIDGLSISITYENNTMKHALTRGNGIRGDIVTEQMRSVARLPRRLSLSSRGIQSCEIRGEIYISKQDFHTINEDLISRGEIPLVNSRNAAAGSLRLKNTDEIRSRKLSICLYRIVLINGKAPFDTHYESIRFLDELGLPTPLDRMRVCEGIEEAIHACKAFEEEREKLPFEIDGLVIKTNSLSLQEKLGETSHHPRWAIAYKLKAEEKESAIKEVEFQVGRTGVITPVAKIDAVRIAGATISSISLFNEDFLKEKDIRLGDTVVVERSGDVIPYISRVVFHKRTGKETPIAYPAKCPACNSPLEKQDASWRCINERCIEQIIGTLILFCSKDALDIKGLGEQIVRRLVKEKLLNNITDIFKLPFDKIKTMEGFGEKSAENLALAIERSKRAEMHRVLYGLGIRFIGITTAEKICAHIKDIQDLADFSEEELQRIDDIGPKAAASIAAYFKKQEHIDRIEELRSLGVELNVRPNKQVFLSDALWGKSFLFTGSLTRFSREKAERILEKHGAQIASSVNKKLSYLVVGDKPGSKLEKAQKILSIEVMNEEDFIQFLANKKIDIE